LETNEILIQLRKIFRAVNVENKRLEKEFGISIPQILCLRFFNESADFKSTNTEIKKALNLNASTVTGILNRLEKKELIARLPKALDKRVTFFVLTHKGAELVRCIPKLLHTRIEDNLHKSSANEVEKIKESLDSLVRFMDISADDLAPIVSQDPRLDG